MANIGSNRTVISRSKKWLVVLLLVGFGLAIGRLFYFSIIKGDELQQKAYSLQLRDTTISAKRGSIYDTNGKTLAQSATVWQVVLAPAYFKTDEQRTYVAQRLAEILDLDQNDVYEKTKEKTYYSVVKRKVETVEKDKVLKLSQELAKKYNLGNVIELIEDYKRYYPYGDFASTIIGFTGMDGVGREGIEYQYDTQLTGTPGRVITAKDVHGTEMPYKYEQKIDAQDGNNITLTIDETIQHIMEKYLQQGIKQHKVQDRAVAIMMEVKTGAILGMAVEGGYDLNDPFTIADSNTQKEIDKLPNSEKEAAEVEALQKQWRNKAVADTYYPGSVFKVITSCMGWSEGVITDSSTYTCTGSYVPFEGASAIHCHNTAGHGTQTYKQALSNSCNPAFMMIGQAVGAEKFWEYYQAFGFSEKTGIDLPGEQSDIFFGDGSGKMQPMDLAVASFGQNFAITPIQMVTAISSVGNGGKLMQPYIVKEITDSDGNVVESKTPIVKRQVVSEEVTKKVIDAMEENATTGSAKNGYVAGYKVAGKTGTSEKKIYHNDGSQEYIASFCGFAPADDPQVCLLVYFDDPVGDSYYGSAVAAPVFANIMSEVLPYLNVEAEYTEEEIAQMDTTAENYVGKSVSEAENLVSSGGFTPVVMGSGDTVISQVPTAQSRLPQQGTVVLYTDEESMSDDVVEVPDLTNMTVAQANSTAAMYNLNISVVGSNADGEGISYSQGIKAGSKVKSGTVISVNFEQDSNYGNGVM
ncbi:penicillin-binding transpeptidase domain-containing protein [Oscillospiraceae bacterium LCP25S3_E10]|nr:PASTA domain-containing protein [Ruminococcus sp.]MDD6447958.1 penicillin-binding transpeptidase domain-containing protein [Ruminococcus sp.]